MVSDVNDKSKGNPRRRRNTELISGRKFNADELELMLLWFISSTPAHGYELIQRFDRLSEGYYSPSPGVLYPALGRLEALGYLHAKPAGRRKIYNLTHAGQNYVDTHAERTGQLLAILKHAAKKMVWMKYASDNVPAAAEATGWLPEFIQTRKALKAALLRQSDASHEQQQRVIAILQQTIAEILKTTSSSPTDLKLNPDTQTEITHDN